MYNLILHIEYLLLRHDCVVVPGIGAFLNEHMPASFDADRGVWLPMKRVVRFNAALTHDDGLLATSFSRRDSVSFQEGRELMHRSISAMNEMMDREGEVTVGRLGVLRREDDTLRFLPAGNSGVTPGYHEAPVCVKVAETEKEVVTVNEKRKFDTDKNYYIAVNKVFARVAAVVTILLVAALTMILPQTDRVKIDKASVIPVDNILNKEVAAPAEPEPAPVIKESVVEEPADAVVEEQAATYHAIVATFEKASEAEKYVSQYDAATDYKLQVVNGRTKARVSALRAATREQLLADMRASEFRALYPDAWIWQQSE